MDKREDFDREMEYDFDPNEMLDEDNNNADVEFEFLSAVETADKDVDLDELLDDEFLAMLDLERPKIFEKPIEEEPAEEPEDLFIPEIAEEEPQAEEEPAPQEPQAFDEDEDVKEYTRPPVPAFDMDGVDSPLGEDFIKTYEEVRPEPDENDQPPVPVVEVQQGEEVRVAPAPRRRKKMTKERIIKEVYLPPIIALLTVVLMITFISTSIRRSIRLNQEQQAAVQSSQEAAASALEQEARRLVSQATTLAQGYNYDAALNLLDTFSGDKSQSQTLLDAINAISQAKDQVKPIDDPSTIPNLSFHCLIADPNRAFSDTDWGASYNTNYVTTDEFSKILEQLYANGYVLVDFDSFIKETVGEDGKITYAPQAIYLPDGKKPFMLTETLVNYELFTVDSDGDMEPDKNGDGFASKLVVDASGNIVNEYVDSQGNVLYGAYDMVPILENFIKAHPDFCYQGARAILAVTGEDGVFGYRIMHSVKQSKGEDYYNEQVEGAKKIAAALRNAGYTIACYTYSNADYSAISATKIDVDLDNWKKEVVPVLGEVPIMVFAKANDGNYQDAKYNVLKGSGFRYFIGAANAPFTEVTVNSIRQGRIMVTGKQMRVNPDLFTKYFTPSQVLSELRGN